jgi:acyl-coenzyme A synthetase/AMP-(fatty) acid ligase
MDHQIKLRGVRIEPGEIDARLRALTGIRDAVTVLREDHPGQKRLVAYVVAAAEVPPSVEEWRSSLRRTLPEAMIPSQFMLLEALPRTANGKVDRTSLPVPSDERQGTESRRQLRRSGQTSCSENESESTRIFSNLAAIPS